MIKSLALSVASLALMGLFACGTEVVDDSEDPGASSSLATKGVTSRPCYKTGQFTKDKFGLVWPLCGGGCGHLGPGYRCESEGGVNGRCVCMAVLTAGSR
jgi:hypothetical protein